MRGVNVLKERMKNPSASRSRQSLRVHIEELVFHGFAPGNRFEVAAAIQDELVRLLTERSLAPEAIGGRDAIDAGAFEATHGARAERIGAQVAQSIYEGLGNEVTPRLDHSGKVN